MLKQTDKKVIKQFVYEDGHSKFIITLENGKLYQVEVDLLAEEKINLVKSELDMFHQLIAIVNALEDAEKWSQ